MKIRKIDKMPPEPTGNVKTDIEKMRDYLNYLRENINFALNTIEKEDKTND